MIYLKKMAMQIAGNKFQKHIEFLQIDKKKDKTYNIKMDRRYEYTMYQKQIQMTNTLGKKEIH